MSSNLSVRRKLSKSAKPHEVFRDMLDVIDMSMEDVAKQSGVSMSIVSKICSGRQFITPLVAGKLEDVM